MTMRALLLLAVPVLIAGLEKEPQALPAPEEAWSIWHILNDPAPTPSPVAAPVPAEPASAPAPPPAEPVPAPAPAPAPAEPAPVPAPVPEAPKPAAAPVPEAPQAPTPSAPAPVPEEPEKPGTPSAHAGRITNAVQAFKLGLWSLVTAKEYQSVVALFALQLGLVALYDGRSFFKILVVICITSVVFCLVLSQLRPTWVEEEATVMKYVVSLEVGVFIGAVGYKGWEGTQLLLGLVLGMYMYSNVQCAALIIPYIQNFAKHSAWAVVVAPLMVAVGTWMTHERFGAAKVFGVLAPLFGSTLVVATLEYALMLLCSVPGAGRVLGVAVAPADVPSVFEFWYMIVYPMHSEAVGYFQFANKNTSLAGIPIELDRVLGIFFCLVFFAVATSMQLRADREGRALAQALRASAALRTPLLPQVRQLPKSI